MSDQKYIKRIDDLEKLLSTLLQGLDEEHV